MPHAAEWDEDEVFPVEALREAAALGFGGIGRGALPLVCRHVAMHHPNAGIVEPEEMDFREVLAVASPYLGELVGEFTDWTPLAARNRLFVETVDTSDPWQFSNLRA